MAGAAAALIAFLASAAFDWVWQVPVLPVSFLLLAAAVLAPSLRQHPGRMGKPAVGVVRAGAVALALACLVAIAVPLATANDVRASQSAASSGNRPLALQDAREAARVEPGAASPQIQLALVEELRGDLPAALSAIKRATHDEPQNWATWLILARLQAEDGKPKASLAAFRRARSLNPRSLVFAHASRS
jgi:tetratricopeptide (TPR) repeat protein